MIKNNVLGIIFANSNDESVPELTKRRSMASVPFGGRYRLIDFSLSNFVNAGISKVGVITKSNYNSLLDHLGSGISWDLDRKNGGLFILPPFGTESAGFFSGKMDALAGIMTFLTRSHEEYVVLCDSDIVSNIDIDKLIAYHKESNAGVTIAYKNGPMPVCRHDTMLLDIDANQTVSSIKHLEKSEENCNYGLDIFVVRRELLIKIIETASRYHIANLTKDLISSSIGELIIKAYKVTEFAEIIYSKERYAEISMSLLKQETRKNLFSQERPVYTKTRDDMPTRYGVSSSADNSLIASGCIIDGTVKNSVIFRGVEIGKGAEITNCIIMQGAKIGNGCKLQNVIIDKTAVISDDIALIGKDDKYIYIEKEKVI